MRPEFFGDPITRTPRNRARNKSEGISQRWIWHTSSAAASSLADIVAPFLTLVHQIFLLLPEPEKERKRRTHYRTEPCSAVRSCSVINGTTWRCLAVTVADSDRWGVKLSKRMEAANATPLDTCPRRLIRCWLARARAVTTNFTSQVGPGRVSVRPLVQKDDAIMRMHAVLEIILVA